MDIHMTPGVAMMFATGVVLMAAVFAFLAIVARETR